MIGVSYLYQRVDEEIRCRVEEKFAGHYASLKVKVRSAELLEGEGIKIRGVTILEPGAKGPRAELLSLDEVFLVCQADLNELVSGEPEISRVVLRNLVLPVTRRPDGSWSTSKLLPLPVFGKHPPEVVIENATIEIFDPLANPTRLVTFRDVNLKLDPPQPGPLDGSGQSQAPGLRKFAGTLSGDFLRQVEVKGVFDPDSFAWTVSGSAQGLEVSPEIRESLPPDWATKLSALGSLRGLAQLDEFRVSCDPDVESPLSFDVSGKLTRGRIDEQRLGRSLTDVNLDFRLNNNGLVVQNMSADSGQTNLVVRSFYMDGFDPSGFRWLDAEARDLELNPQLLEVLPESFREHWDKYDPAGRVNVAVKLGYDGQTWNPDVTVDCRDVSFAHVKFPYRLQHARGVVTLKNDTASGDLALSLDLTAYSGSQPVDVWGDAYHLTSDPLFSFKAKGKMLPLDETLLRAIPGKSQLVVRSLDPDGFLDFFLHLERKQPGQRMGSYLNVTLHNCRLQYDQFPYPLNNIHGTLEMIDNHWDFRDLVGTNGTGQVFCNGELDSIPGGSRWELRFRGENVHLEEELRDSLAGPNVRQLWNDLKLQGRVDFDAKVSYSTEQGRPSVFFRAEPRGDTASIEPVWWPYRLANLQGTVVYNDGQVTIEQLKAEHGPTKLSAAVNCGLSPDGSWHLRLDRLFVDQLRFDNVLTEALPEQLKKAVVQLSPGGQVNLGGSVDFARGGQPTDPVTSKWNLGIDFHQGSMDVGVELENVTGGVTLAGSYDGEKLRCRGELDVDTLTYRGVQLTYVEGPLEIFNDRVLLGATVDPPPNELPKSIKGRLFDGMISTDGQVLLGTVPQYHLHALLSQADLAEGAKQLTPERQNLKGKVWAGVELNGAGENLNSLRGRGSIHLREADIYELPVMIALLKVFTNHQPDRKAFSTSDIDFHIQGGHIYLTDISFDGDAISLEGSGDMDFESRIRLTFRAMLGNGKWQVPGLREVLGRAGQQIMVIHIGGTLQNPEKRNEPFPGLHQVLQRLREELQMTTGAQGFFPQTGRTMPYNRFQPLRRR